MAENHELEIAELNKKNKNAGANIRMTNSGINIIINLDVQSSSKFL